MILCLWTAGRIKSAVAHTERYFTVAGPKLTIIHKRDSNPSYFYMRVFLRRNIDQIIEDKLCRMEATDGSGGYIMRLGA